MKRLLLEVEALTKTFVSRHRRSGRREVHAVQGVSFGVVEGESVGIAGESGSGKSTLARLILRLEAPTAGQVRFDGRDLRSVPDTGRAGFRREMQAVFQDANGALSPRMHVRDIVAEPLLLQEPGAGAAAVDERVACVLAQVGLPAHVVRRFPHELSGGQKQRVAIARALIVNPRMLILDEPVSALDVSVRSQVLNLLLELQERYGLTYLMIAHDLAVLRHVTERLLVMYRGRVVEQGGTEDVLHRPQHPYTRQLVSAVPRVGGGRTRIPVAAEPAGESGVINGCGFAPRCPVRAARCLREVPLLRQVSANGPPDCRVACHAVGDRCWPQKMAAGEFDASGTGS